jgi:hypothetical protein
VIVERRKVLAAKDEAASAAKQAKKAAKAKKG